MSGLQEPEVNIFSMLQLSLDGLDVNLKLFRDLRNHFSTIAKCKIVKYWYIPIICS